MKTESIDYYKNENPEYYKDKRVIVTGATGGIGSLLTSTLIELGSKVVAVAKDENKLKEMFDSEIENGSLQYKILDFSTEIYYNNTFSDIMMKLEGKLDIMFLCHGKFAQGDIMETDLKEYDEITIINTRSFLAMISLAIPFLKYTKGNIVVLSSLESYIPIRKSFLMTTSKCMVNMMIKDTALEVATFGVRVNGVAPGVTNTDFRKDEFDENKEENNKKYLELQGNKNLLNKRVIEPDEVVDTMLFLGCDDAGFITGEIITVDSGFSLNHCNKYSEY